MRCIGGNFGRKIARMKPIRRYAPLRLLALLATAVSLQAQAAPEAKNCNYAPVAKLPLRYTGPSLMITTGGSINGTPAELLVDTGAYRTFFTRTGTERRNMSLRRTGQVVYGIGGSSPVYETRITDFSAGPARLTKGFIPVLGDFGFTPSFDGILGSPFLLQADLEVSLATKEMTLFYPENCAETWLGYWSDKVIDIPFKSHHEPGLNPHFTVLVNGKKLEAMIDTGAATSSILRDAASSAGVEVDVPGSTRTHDSVGAGERKIATWLVTLKTFKIGDETVENAEFSVIDTRNHGVDVILGADFLRAHRVLFAMSQQKLYFSYEGGEPFGQRSKLEPWIRTEADAGNADAQLALSNAYRRGKLVPRDDALAAQWLEKAALGGSPHALLRSGRALMGRGEPADLPLAATRLRAALDQLPAEREGALWLYIARVRAGQPELAKQELTATFARSERDEWPKPISDFYLGTLTLEKLLAQAADDRSKGRKRHCEAVAAVAEWQLAHGQPEQARMLKTGAGAACATDKEATN
jgi:predicted aspartyl protease